MPIIYPVNRKEVFDRIATDIQAALPTAQPFLRNSFMHALAIAYAGGDFDLYKTIEELQKQMFPDSATGEFADRWGSYVNVYRNAATQSIGFITVTGLDSAQILVDTTLQSSTGDQFKTLTTTTCELQSISITSMTRSGGMVTVTTVATHHLANGNSVIISGAVQTEYNGTQVITVTGLASFTFEIDTTPATPATGTIIASATYANVEIRSISYGAATNLTNGSELFFTTVPTGIDINAYVQYDGLIGGADIESDDNFKKRYMYAYQHPVAFFNVAEIISKCLEVPGVTRVFVDEIYPDVGQVTIHFMRDNDANPIPTAAQVKDVKDHLLTIKPAHVDPNDVIVLAPTAYPVNFTFSLLEPNDSGMQAAIIASLQAFFSEIPIVGYDGAGNLSRSSYASAIYYTVNPATGAFVTNFVLSTPPGDILVPDGHIATLGTILFP